MLHIGVDEAGYGPLLGPLVIGAAVFREDGDAPVWTCDLRDRLGDLVTRAHGAVGGDDALPVPVDDSKRILQRFGLPGMARGIGMLASAMDVPPPADLEDLLVRFSDRMPADYATVPWLGELTPARVPRYPWTGPLDERFAERGVQALDVRVLPVDAFELNAAFERVGNKARVLGLCSAELLLSVLDRYPDEDAQVVMDRQGGRKDYAAYLGEVFPFAQVTPEAGSEGEARYTVRLPGRVLRIRFVTRGDQVCLAVGFASMAAKLTRELFMDRLNAWFQARIADLRPTAGYVTDGRRFLADVGEYVNSAGIDRSLLVRSR